MEALVDSAITEKGEGMYYMPHGSIHPSYGTISQGHWYDLEGSGATKRL